MDTKQKFLETVRSHIDRPGMNELVDWLCASDFFTAPASTRFHECFEGGLALHSLNVLHHLWRLNEHYKTGFSMDTMAVVALFHDLCKVGCYKVSMRNVKDEKTGQWHKEPFYKFEEDFKFGGHGSKSVFLLRNFISLTPDEAVAINCHMGVENGKWEVMDAFRDCPLAYLLHVADMASTIPGLN